MEHCDVCGEWDLPDGVTDCDGCNFVCCPDCIGEDGICNKCVEEDDDGK